MVALTLQDVDNFDVIVKHCETAPAQLKLSYTNKTWHLTIAYDYIDGSTGWVKHSDNLTEALQMAADEIQAGENEPITDTIDTAIRLPAMHNYPDSELLRRSGMHAAAEEAQRLRRLDKGLAPDDKILGTDRTFLGTRTGRPLT